VGHSRIGFAVAIVHVSRWRLDLGRRRAVVAGKDSFKAPLCGASVDDEVVPMMKAVKVRQSSLLSEPSSKCAKPTP